MTGALLLLGAALAVWPGRRATRRARWDALVRGRAQDARRSLGPVPLPAVCGIGVATVSAVLSTPLVAALAGGGAALAARAEQRRRAGVRDEARLSALAEALAALGAELRSGRSLDEATAAAVASCADDHSGRALVRAVRAPVAPTSGDSRESGESAESGNELERALRRVSAATLLSTRTGCSLAAVVGAVEDDLRARRRQRLDLRSATAGSRASAWLLAGLPVLGLAMGGGVGADPWRVLTTTPTGQVLLVAGTALEAAGLAWSARLVRRAAP